MPHRILLVCMRSIGLIFSLRLSSAALVPLSRFISQIVGGILNIGFVLTASGLAGLITQVPGGELIDIVRSRCALVGAGAAAVALALLIFALRADFPSVVASAVIQGAAGSILGPGVAAISLGLWGTTRSPSGSAAISASPPSVALRRPRSWV